MVVGEHALYDFQPGSGCQGLGTLCLPETGFYLGAVEMI